MLTIAELHHGAQEPSETVTLAIPDETQDTDDLRVAHYRRERNRHLAVEAELHGVQLERENALVWVAWTDDIPGECDLVTDEGCTCHVFRTWQRCEHHALLLKRLGRI